jgi:preprotein translocase subunit SecF
LFELVPPGTHIDFVGKRRITLVISVALLLAGAVAALPQVRGIQYGIDFAGGSEMQVAFPETPTAAEEAIRAAVSACGVDPTVVRYGEAHVAEFLIRFRPVEDEASTIPDACPVTPEQREQMRVLREEIGADAGAQGELVDRLRYALENSVGPVEIERVEFVGPRVGAELRRDGIRALFWASVFILVYIGFRFSMRFAPGAVVALLHDIGITAGLFVIFGLEFDLRVLAAMLAILGYSLNDTIIIYDRIRENMERHTKHDLEDVLNRSINQTLSRTVLTSGTTMVALLCLLFLGGAVIWPFALAMTIGVVVGTYSSIFVAAPMLLFLEKWMGRETAARPAARAVHPAQKSGKRSKRSRAASG